MRVGSNRANPNNETRIPKQTQNPKSEFVIRAWSFVGHSGLAIRICPPPHATSCNVLQPAPIQKTVPQMDERVSIARGGGVRREMPGNRPSATTPSRCWGAAERRRVAAAYSGTGLDGACRAWRHGQHDGSGELECLASALDGDNLIQWISACATRQIG